MNIKTRLGLRIKKLRGRLGKSQLQLAGDASLDRTYINGVENGRRNISIENVEKIALALDLTVKSFFDDSLFDSEETGK
jgi:transcriptional regulator with XRE-family HTH domain